MATVRTVRLTPDQLALKAATRAAVKAAGGQDFISAEVGRAQSRISDYCSSSVAEFMPLDIVARVEELSTGSPGHPHITRALARRQGDMVLDCGDESRRYPLAQLLAEVAGESSDVIRILANGTGAADAAARCIDSMSPQQKAELAREVDDLMQVLSDINKQIGA